MNRPTKFSDNLKYYRKKQGLTQSGLAQMIGYTEKSVSKWENGNALPPMDMCVRLAELFKISLDELMFEKTTRHYFLGIDGGGTKTVFKLTDDKGGVIDCIYKGSSNPNDIGMEKATEILKDGINEICRGIPYSNVTMFAGISGGGLSGNNVVLLNNFFKRFNFYAFDNGSDIENLVSLCDYEKCILVIMGTGFIVYALDGEKRKRISGWGQFFDEGGSGYTLGRDAVTAVLSAGDGSGRQTKMTELMEQRLGESAESHLNKFYQGGKKYIATFSDLVFKAAEAGDMVACGILENNMDFVASKISAGLRYLADGESEKIIPVMFGGGISRDHKLLFPMIKKNITQQDCQLIRIESEPIEGALKRAERIYEMKNNEEKK